MSHSFRKRLKSEIIKSKYTHDNLSFAFSKCFNETEVGVNLRNDLLQKLITPTSTKPTVDLLSKPMENHSVISSFRSRWESHVVAALDDLRREMVIPLICHPSKSNVDHSSLRYIWEPSELLAVLTSINPPNSCITQPTWSLIKLSLHTPSFSTLTGNFHFLNPSHCHFGFDDLVDVPQSSELIARLKVAESVIKRIILCYRNII
ncbi:hypothetical protein GEMRC1_007130 [Eukaryota sp. GEM-RC1]